VSSISWKGYTWSVADYNSKYSGNTVTSNDVFVDSNGYLHLKCVYRNGYWSNLNVLLKNIGYGSYNLTVQTNLHDLCNANPHWIFAPFTYDNALPSDGYGEQDIEIGDWGQVGAYNGNQVQWGEYRGGQMVQHVSTSGTNVKYEITWRKDLLRFSESGPSQPYASWSITDPARIAPNTGTMQYIIESWIYPKKDPQNSYGFPNGYSIEVVLTDFKYTPA
jgi:hypothetical protein